MNHQTKYNLRKNYCEVGTLSTFRQKLMTHFEISPGAQNTVAMVLIKGQLWFLQNVLDFGMTIVCSKQKNIISTNRQISREKKESKKKKHK